MSTLRDHLTPAEQKRCEDGDNSILDLAMSRKQKAQQSTADGGAILFLLILQISALIGFTVVLPIYVFFFAER